MRIRAGFTLGYKCVQPTPMLLALNIRPERRADLLTDQSLTFDPPVPLREYIDGFGNSCGRIVAPAGPIRISTLFEIHDSGEPDKIARDGVQHELGDLPYDVIVFLLGSRYCDTDRLSDFAWRQFGMIPPGWARVQAICDFVHDHITFGYEHANAQRTAHDGFVERKGVCRDFAHLAVTLCRCMNIPARYCTGYLGDIGVPPDIAPMDFSAWFQVYLSGDWHTCDARHNKPRIGRILMAVGRDATDVALTTSFGASQLEVFRVLTEELDAPRGGADATVAASEQAAAAAV